MTVIFQETGLIGMLEASDYYVLDSVSTFIGAFLDVCCGSLESADMTKSYTRNVDLVSCIYRRDEEPGRDYKRLTKLKQMICMFKNHSRRVLENCQSSRTGTWKWYWLDHFPDDLRHTGGVKYFTGSLYQRSHRSFKAMYGITSRRTSFAMLEILRINDRRAQKEREKTDIASVERLNESQVQSVWHNAAYLVHSGPYTTISELENAPRRNYDVNCLGCSQVQVSAGSIAVCKCLEIDVLGVFLRLLKKSFLTLESGSRLPKKHRLQLPFMAFIAGVPTPSANYNIEDASIIVPKSDLRSFQRMVGCER